MQKYKCLWPRRVTLGAQTFGTSGNHKVISQDKRLRGEVRTQLIKNMARKARRCDSNLQSETMNDSLTH